MGSVTSGTVADPHDIGEHTSATWFAWARGGRYSPRVPRLASWILLLAVLVVAAGCPKRGYRAIPDVPKGGDATARQRFTEARSRFEQDGSKSADPEVAAEFEAIAREYKDDPVAPFALLYAGISSVRAKQPDKALVSLERLLAHDDANEAVVRRGQLYKGFALVYAGRAANAVGPLEAGKGALSDDDEKTEWHAAMAEAHAGSGNSAQAIVYYDRFYRRATASEKSYALARIRELGSAVDDKSIRDVLDRTGSGPAMAVLGERLGGDAAEDARDARRDLGLEAFETGEGRADPELVGALLPLSGRRAPVGEVALRGLSLAAGSYSEESGRGALAGQPRPFTLEVRDAGSNAADAARLAGALAQAGAIGVIGPVDRQSVDSAGAEAQHTGLPILTLDPRAESAEGMATVFHIMHSAEDRARTLARFAIEQGIRDFAILGPENGYGRAVGDAFRDEVQKLGGTVVVRSTYKPDDTSFGKSVAELRKPWQALFVPERSRRLELLAPALAAANFVAQAPGSGKPKHGRGMLLLSTAEALDDGFVRSAGRYANGAVLAPGFYADREEQRIADFVTRFEAVYGRAPTALEAYAFDAALVLRAAVESGAESRSAVLRYLARADVAGVTGRVSFDGARRRRDRGVLFTVGRGIADEPVIRALR